MINCAFRVNLDAPETRLVGVPTGQLEEGRDQLEVRCLADANPPASILWRKRKGEGVTEVASIGETLMFSPIYRNHAAVYLCEASNIEGESSPISVQVSVNCTCAAVCYFFFQNLHFNTSSNFSLLCEQYHMTMRSHEKLPF